MSRPTRALEVAHIAGALLLGLTAVQHAAASLWPQAIAAAVLTGLFAEGLVREREYADARRQLAAATAPEDVAPPGHAAVTDELVIAWQELHDCCCLNAWLTAGAEHDAVNCTRTENR